MKCGADISVPLTDTLRILLLIHNHNNPKKWLLNTQQFKILSSTHSCHKHSPFFFFFCWKHPLQQNVTTFRISVSEHCPKWLLRNFFRTIDDDSLMSLSSWFIWGNAIHISSSSCSYCSCFLEEKHRGRENVGVLRWVLLSEHFVKDV